MKNMKKYEVGFPRLVYEIYVIEAEDIQEAWEKGKEKLEKETGDMPYNLEDSWCHEKVDKK
jgi:hypothetical protein